MSIQNNLDDKYWDDRYKSSQTPWDIGYASQPLTDYIDQLKNYDIEILIPGAGSGYEALYLFAKGFKNITVADISEVAIENLRKHFPKEINIYHGDFFDIDKKFDLIIEQTFFCALDPLRREDYANKVYELLKINGKLVGVLFNTIFPAGPPFGGSVDEYLKLFSGDFNIRKIEPCYNSIKPRSGSELFIILSKDQEKIPVSM
ncbi:MAG: methyltransferase domain-containing protein [Ferruginibacter sp.]